MISPNHVFMTSFIGSVFDVLTLKKPFVSITHELGFGLIDGTCKKSYFPSKVSFLVQDE